MLRICFCITFCKSEEICSRKHHGEKIYMQKYIILHILIEYGSQVKYWLGFCLLQPLPQHLMQFINGVLTYGGTNWEINFQHKLLGMSLPIFSSYWKQGQRADLAARGLESRAIPWDPFKQELRMVRGGRSKKSWIKDVLWYFCQHGKNISLITTDKCAIPLQIHRHWQETSQKSHGIGETGMGRASPPGFTCKGANSFLFSLK